MGGRFLEKLLEHLLVLELAIRQPINIWAVKICNALGLYLLENEETEAFLYAGQCR
jgi:hypothetical protein